MSALPQSKVLLNLLSLDEIQIKNVATYLKKSYDPKLLENTLGNRLLYPATIPTSEEGLLFDEALIRESLKIKSSSFYNQNLKKIIIPHIFLEEFPDISRLVWIFADSIRPSHITSLWLMNDDTGQEDNLGSYIKPEIINTKGIVNITINHLISQIEIGTVKEIPASKLKVDLLFQSAEATLLEKNSFGAEVTGGSLGIIIDLRDSK